jgi:hypothetical protein
MFTNPTTTAALASQHRRELLAQAGAHRLARATRQRRPTGSRPSRLRGVLRLAGVGGRTG